MRNPFSPRVFVTLSIALLLASALPAPTAGQGQVGPADFSDIRIMSVRAVTKTAAATPPYATMGPFPEPDTQIEFEVRVLMFPNRAATTPALYEGPIRILAHRYADGDLPGEASDGTHFLDAWGNCYDNNRANVKIDPAEFPNGRPFHMKYHVQPDASGVETFTFETNVPCPNRDNIQTGQTTFVPCCNAGNDDANDERDLSIAVGRVPDFGIVNLLCTSAAACNGNDRKAGGPGVAIDPASVSGGFISVPGVQICSDLRQDNLLDNEGPCVAPPCVNSIPQGDCLVQFRTMVSALFRAGQTTGWPQSGADTNAVVSETTGPHTGEKFISYPHEKNALVAPILIPLNFEVYKIHATGESGVDASEKLTGLLLSQGTDEGQHDPLAPNCPDGVRRCAQWLADATGGAPDFQNLNTPIVTTPLNLKGLGGDFELRAYVNGMEPQNASTFGCGVRNANFVPAPEKECGNNVAVFPFHIKAPDLVVDITETEILAKPAAYDTTATLSFGGVIRNVGDLPVSNDIGGGTTEFQVRFYIDDRAYLLPTFADKVGTLNPGDARAFTVSLAMNGEGCADENCPRFVPPGTRKARVVVDDTEHIFESEEENNEDVVEFLVKDTQAPKLAALRLFNARNTEITGTTPEIPRGAPFNVTTVITDTDHNIGNVQVEFLKPNGESYACPCAQVNQSSRTKNDMWFTTTVAKGLADVGEWTITVKATDPSGQVATPVVKKVKVIAFKKIATFDYKDFVDSCSTPGCDPTASEFFPKNGTVLPFLGSGFDYNIKPAWTLPDDPRDQHGFLPAWTSQGVSIRFEPPSHNWTDVTVENDKTLVLKSRFGNVVSKFGGGVGGDNTVYNFSSITAFNAENCVTGSSCQRRIGDTKFQSPLAFGFGDGEDEIGRYNITLNITDVGGASKEYLTTFDIRDAKPYANMTLRNVTGAGGNPDEGQTIKPGQSIRYRATGHDDQGFEPNGTIHLNFTHLTGNGTTVDKYVNLSMGKPTSSCARNATTNLFDCPFQRRVKTGTSIAGADLTLAGKWQLTMWSEDKYHNFGKNATHMAVTQITDTNGQRFVLQDTGQPMFIFLNDTVAANFNGTNAPYGTLHSEEEVGGTVTFYARVADDLDASVYLEVKEGPQIFADFVKMNGPDRYGNYTYNMTFDAPHTLEYRFKVVDSNTLRDPVFSDAKGVTIHENLPPRMDVLLANVPDHGYFAKAAPVLEFKVYDTAQGVDSASIKMTVDGENVTTLEKTLTDAGHGFLVRYTRDPSKPWVHGQKVNFTLEAKDLSVPPKLTKLSNNFTVDAIAPKSRIVSFDPRYVAGENDLWNVSLETRFTPTSSDDDDGLPTGVAEGGIKYQFIRSGPGREFVYNGTPFPMSDLPAAQNVGNADYYIRVVGTDVVGNREIGSTTNTLHVFLDQVPPELVRSKLKTTGRVINATFDDPASGTKGAIVHYRYDAGAFASVPMVKSLDGTWVATVPANPLAKNVCYYLEATDNVGNRKQFGDEQAPPHCFPIGNQPPSITITAPSNGQTVSGSVTLRWEASDRDGDPLTFRVFYKPTAGRDELELTTLQAGTQSYVLTTDKLGPDGQYDIRVTASDGNFFEESTVRVEVVNAKAAIGDIAPDKPLVAPGDMQCIRTRITKANVAVVEADVLLDGVKVKTVPLADNGQGCDVRAGDGIYGGGVVLDEAGSYDVEIYARYIEAGEPKETRTRENGLFEVKLSAVDVIGKNPVLFGAFVTLAVAVFAVGGFAVYRRWK